MTELILSEITRMANGYCVIGLEQTDQGYRSVRPMPPRGYAWPHPWPYSRGDRLRFDLSPLPCVSPHVEDMQSTGLPRLVGRLSQTELLRCLRSAELATSSREFFGGNLRGMPSGALWADPDDARRSVCGCEFHWIQFFRNYGRWRAKVLLGSLEVLENVRIVDRDWGEFLDGAVSHLGSENVDGKLLPLLNGPLSRTVYTDPDRFARFGLSRPFNGNRCWLMLDSLFPPPSEELLAKVSEALPAV